jgi:hypothetical protein
MKPCEAEFDYSHGVMMINSSLLRSNISSSVRLLRRLPLTHSLSLSSPPRFLCLGINRNRIPFKLLKNISHMKVRLLASLPPRQTVSHELYPRLASPFSLSLLRARGGGEGNFFFMCFEKSRASIKSRNREHTMGKVFASFAIDMYEEY